MKCPQCGMEMQAEAFSNCPGCGWHFSEVYKPLEREINTGPETYPRFDVMTGGMIETPVLNLTE